MHIENIVIGKPIVPVWMLLGKDENDFNEVEAEKTVFEEERFLPKLLVKHGIFKSNTEVRKNRPDLFISLDKLDFLALKIGKKRLWIVVGE